MPAPGEDKQGILELLNLEDTVCPVICAFAIERSKGVFLAAAASPFNSHRPSRAGTKNKNGLTTSETNCYTDQPR